MAESTIDENAAEEEGAVEEAAEESAATEDEGAVEEAAEESAATEDEGADAAEGTDDEEGAADEAPVGDSEAGGEEGEEEEVIPRVPLRERFDAFLKDAMLNEQSPAYLIQSNLIILVILYSIGSILVESVPSIYRDYEPFFKVTEVIVVAIFVIEYAANVYVAKPSWTSHVLGKWGIIDFFAVAPSILSWITIPGLNVLQFAKILRILRFLRLMRLLKLTKGAKTDFKKLAGVTLLGSGVPFLAGGILLPLPQSFKVILGCAGFVMIGIGDLIYLGSLHIKPLSPEEQARRNRQVFLTRVAKARGIIKDDEPESETEPS